MDYPMHTEIFPDEEQRKKKLPKFMEFSIRSGMKFGNAYASSDRLEAIAVWLDPAHSIPSIIDSIRVGGLSMILQIKLRTLIRAKKIWDRTEQLHEDHAPDRHWYLESLAVQEEHRGEGLARKLLEAKFDELNKENTAAYLETHDPNNVAIYERLGFETVCKTDILNTKMTHYSMVRYPEN